MNNIKNPWPNPRKISTAPISESVFMFFPTIGWSANTFFEQLDKQETEATHWLPMPPNPNRRER